MKEFKGFWEIYEEAFPKDERRSKKEQQKITQNPLYQIIPLYEDHRPIGFICVWDLEEFLFVEHFAMKKECRGKGYGKSKFQSFIRECGKMVILEVETPTEEVSKMRIGFYESIGFHRNPYNYQQPPLGEDKNPISLLLMSYPEKISSRYIEEVERKIHKIVYGTTDYLKNKR